MNNVYGYVYDSVRDTRRVTFERNTRKIRRGVCRIYL